MRTHTRRVRRANAQRPGLGWFWALIAPDLGPIMTGVKRTRAEARREVAYWAACFYPTERTNQ